MLLPKCKYRKHRPDRKKAKAECLAADNWRCVNPDCPGLCSIIDWHHIVKRSEGGSDSVENTVSLCRYACHDKAENGYVNDEGEYVSGRQFMIGVLRKIRKLRPRSFRWSAALERLEVMEDLKSVGKGA